jgi:NADH-quinone oxidoreductase subunit C
MSKKVVRAIKKAFKDDVLGTHAEHGDHTVIVKPGRLLEIARFLRDEPDMNMNHFCDLTVVDWPEREDRFEVVVHFHSLTHGHRVRLKAGVNASDPVVPSLTSVYSGADWFEREAFDMYGVRFDGHPDLRRILLWEEFEGHPLRKDYPKERRQCPVPFREDHPDQPPPFRERP